jgi:hypothetical protein
MDIDSQPPKKQEMQTVGDKTIVHFEFLESLPRPKGSWWANKPTAIAAGRSAIAAPAARRRRRLFH